MVRENPPKHCRGDIQNERKSGSGNRWRRRNINTDIV